MATPFDAGDTNALVALAGVGAAVVDAVSATFLSANVTFCERAGLSQAELLGGVTVSDVVHPDDVRAACDAVAAAAAAEGSIHEVTARHVRPDATVARVRMRMQRLSAPAGPAHVAIVTTEITPRELDAAALIESMDEGFGVFEVIFDAAERAVDMRCLDMNPAYKRQGGSVRSVGDSVRETNPAAEQYWFDTYGKVALTGEPIRFSQRSGPGSLWFDVFAFRIGAAGQRRVGVLFRNITQQKQAEATLREKEERQDFLLTLSDALRPITDPLTAQAEASRVVAEHLGVRGALYAEVQARADSDYYLVARDYHAPGGASIVGTYRADDCGAALFEALRRGQTVSVEDVASDVRLSNGERSAFARLDIGAFVAAPLLKGGRHVALFAFHHPVAREWSPADLSLVEEAAERTWAAVERAKAEEAFRASDERLQMALAAAEMGTFVWDIGRNHVDCDERALGLFGLPPGNVTSLTDALKTFIHPDDRQRYETAVRSAIVEGGSGALREDIRIIRPDGSLHWVTITGRTVFEGHPARAVRMVGTAADVSERKFTEAALRESEERLLESDRRKDEFLAVLAHELRNPLAPIRTGLELIRLGADSRDAVERVRRMMERQVGHVVRLVDDLLDVSRITSGKIQLQRGLRQLASLVQGALEANRAAIQDGRLELRVDVPEEPIWLDVDPTRFVQVVSNILHNAIKFTDPGGRVSVAAAVERQPGRPGGHLALSVTDTGLGIASEMLPRVFDLFVQGESPADRPHTGLGIGLALARRLMDLHGGSIEAHSDGPGCGSRFTIRLPVARDPSLEPEAHGRSHATISSRVLVIDDNVDAADTTAMLVEALGGVVAVAYDGEAGLARAEALQPHIVLLDLGMPGIDGYETCRRLRRSLGARVFIVALTGWGQEQDKDQALRAGFDAHLTKPADPAALEQLLSAADPRAPAR